MKILWHNLTITKCDIRDFRIILFWGLLNLSFAFEKLFIVIWSPIKDVYWMWIYGWLWLLLIYLALHDYLHDEIEEELLSKK